MNDKKYYKVLLVDDHEVFRLGLRTLIGNTPDIKIVGEAKNCQQLMKNLEVVACDLIILDLWLQEIDGFSILDDLSTNYPQVKRLIVTMDCSEESIQKALVKGVDGYISKEDVASGIVTGIEIIRNGGKYFSQEIQKYILTNYDSLSGNRGQLELLTTREKEIGGLIASGMTNKEIASSLSISAHTVQFHRSNLMHKLNLKNVTDLVKFAVENNL
jgi:DNA-binding NarL/FixJ family response regulator